MSDEVKAEDTAVETKKEKEIKEVQSRFKSWALWLALAALVAFCIKTFAGFDISAQLNNFLNLLLPVLVALGVVNDPTNNKGI